ncbi:sulfurtransferase TusA family protein [Novispirillum itersonii]|uniref:sulfurtransferase TusA family protein n=1 Tax=Novispirillum itersonii TaxID=189 RepID=UPI000374A7A8|nr:sulfurtransferase TusA family protein [Novispirillum itersonii]
MEISPDYFLDITAEICPFTFVKTKLMLEKMSSGQTLAVDLRGAEPLRNVPASVREEGHTVLSLTPAAGDGVMRMLIRKGG